MKESFILHKSQLECIMHLTFEEKGMILDAITKYQFDNVIMDLPRELEIAFRFFKSQLDIDNQKYEKTCERNRLNGQKGGKAQKPTGFSGNPNEPKKATGFSGNPNEPKKATGFSGNPNEPKKADNDNDNDNDNDILFNQFWNLYDKKIGKQNTLKCWRKISPTDIEAIFKHVALYKEAIPDKKFRKDPERYLRNRAWEDEIINSEVVVNQEFKLHPPKGLER